MILLAALLCNYGRGFCLIDIGTGGVWEESWACHQKHAPTRLGLPFVGDTVQGIVVLYYHRPRLLRLESPPQLFLIAHIAPQRLGNSVI